MLAFPRMQKTPRIAGISAKDAPTRKSREVVDIRFGAGRARSQGLSEAVFLGCAFVRPVQCDSAARNFGAVGKVRQRVAAPVDGSEINIQAGDMLDVTGFELVYSAHKYRNDLKKENPPKRALEKLNSVEK